MLFECRGRCEALAVLDPENLKLCCMRLTPNHKVACALRTSWMRLGLYAYVQYLMGL